MPAHQKQNGFVNGEPANNQNIPVIRSIFDFSAEALGQLKTWLEGAGLAIPVTQLIGYQTNTVTLYKLSQAPVTVTDTIVETTLMSEAIPGGKLGTTGALRATLNMNALNTGVAGRPLTFRVKYGGVTFYGDAFSVPSDSIVRLIRLEFIIGNLGATNENFMVGEFRVSNNATTTVAGIGSIGANDDRTTLIGTSADTAVETSVSEALEVSVQADVALTTWTLNGQNYMIEFL